MIRVLLHITNDSITGFFPSESAFLNYFNIVKNQGKTNLLCLNENDVILINRAKLRFFKNFLKILIIIVDFISVKQYDTGI